MEAPIALRLSVSRSWQPKHAAERVEIGCLSSVQGYTVLPREPSSSKSMADALAKQAAAAFIDEEYDQAVDLYTQVTANA